jgi:hypothetical protein
MLCQNRIQGSLASLVLPHEVECLCSIIRLKVVDLVFHCG